jgi:hypothetical protein
MTDEEADKSIFSAPSTDNTISPLPVSLSQTLAAKPNATTMSSDLESLERIIRQVKLVNVLKTTASVELSIAPLIPSANSNVVTVSTLAVPSNLATTAKEPSPPVEGSITHSIEEAGRDATLLGAIPSPAEVVSGVDDVAAQLIAMGLGDPVDFFGTGGKQVIGPGGIAVPDIDKLLPRHTGIYPPTDRMSVFTCKYNMSRFSGDTNLMNLRTPPKLRLVNI